jgi:hypothetical protein
MENLGNGSLLPRRSDDFEILNRQALLQSCEVSIYDNSGFPV